MSATDERLRRWRLVLGGDQADGTDYRLGEQDRERDACLASLYDADRSEARRKGGLGASAPTAVRWLGDIRKFFPTSVVRVMQQDAFARLGLDRMLLEPEMLAAAEPDVHLVATLLSLKSVIPEKTRETARSVVRKVADDLYRRLAGPLRQAVTGSLNRASRSRRPRSAAEVDWPRTIHANLRHYLPERGTLIPETLHGHGRRQKSLREIILCVDQSGSMATSVVYSGIFGAVLASLPALSTRMVVFDTAVVDLTHDLHDPVELLFGTQLGGGTDIHLALSYCQSLVRAPTETTLVLITDLCDGGDSAKTVRTAAAMIAAGVQVVVLLALSDDGAPWYDTRMAGHFAAMGAPVFACTPDKFPELMAATLNRHDIGLWAASHGLVPQRGDDPGL